MCSVNIEDVNVFFHRISPKKLVFSGYQGHFSFKSESATHTN